MPKDKLMRMIAEEQGWARRTKMISIRFTDSEYRRLAAAAKTHRTPAAGLARVFVLAGLDELGTK
jgi:hypothetical protein